MKLILPSYYSVEKELDENYLNTFCSNSHESFPKFKVGQKFQVEELYNNFSKKIRSKITQKSTMELIEFEPEKHIALVGIRYDQVDSSFLKRFEVFRRGFLRSHWLG